MTKFTSLLTGNTYDTEVQVVQLNQKVIAFWGVEIPLSYMVVTDIVHDAEGYKYELIDINSKEFHQTERIYAKSTHKGIGIYYDDRNIKFMEAEKLLHLRKEAVQKREQQEATEKQEKEYKKALKEVGRERLEKLIPVTAKGIIVAEIDTEEEQRTVILGFSHSKRNNFNELRKYAPHFEYTKYLAEYNEDFEDREDYSLGGSYGCWRLRKVVIYNIEYTLDLLAYTAAFEENICIIELEKLTEPTLTNTPKGQYEIIEYSEKAIAVFGDIISIKTQLYCLGGKFNKLLKYGDIQQAGWIFPKSKEEELRKFLDLITRVE